MALVKGTNSYITVAEADIHFADRLDVSAWVDADSVAKAQALVTATFVLEEENWTGTAVSEEQDLAFPRNGEYFDPRLGTIIYLEAATPKRIEKATAELAYHFLNNDGLLDSTGSIESLEIDSAVKLTKIKAPTRMPDYIRKIIKPLLINSAANAWWRAN